MLLVGFAFEVALYCLLWFDIAGFFLLYGGIVCWFVVGVSLFRAYFVFICWF